MIDRMIVPTSVHLTVAIVLVIVAVITTLIVGLLAWRNRPLTRLANVSIAVLQVVLLVQILIGIKLLDQGQGAMQAYVHYMGAILPIGLFFAMRWLPGFERNQARITAVVMVITFLSVFMTATIGSAYVRGTL